MQVVILAGGLGTRLRASVSELPKSMAPIAHKPFLEYILLTLKEAQLTNILILTGYKGEVIEQYFGTGESLGLTIQYSREPEPLGTAGCLLHAWQLLEENFLIINGDTFFDIQYSLLLDFVSGRNLSAAMGLRFSEDISRYGSVYYDENYKIYRFIEKGILPPDLVDGFINGGIYYFQKEIWQLIYAEWDGRPLSLELTVLPLFMQNNQLFGLPLGGKFIDIGTPESYATAQVEIPDCLAQERRPALFLDRDGVLIQDTHYPCGTQVTFLANIYPWVRSANQNKQWVLVVTNQAGIAKGLFTEYEVQLTHRHIALTYEQEGLKINSFFYCPYHPEGTVRSYRKVSYSRKPWPGLILKASEQYRIDLKNSFMIGDKPEIDCIKLPYLISHILQ